jgi:hypothetical protein
MITSANIGEGFEISRDKKKNFYRKEYQVHVEKDQ